MAGLSIAAPAAYAATTSAIFAGRNIKKVDDGDTGRVPVCLGQIGKFINSLNDNVNIFDNLTKHENKVISSASKMVDFASKNVNPLIVASSGLKLLKTDKEKMKDVAIVEAAGLAGMFAGEGWMKKNLDDTLAFLANKITKKDINVNSLKGNKYYSILKGLLFVGGSIASSALGNNIGEELSKKVSNPFVATA